MNRYRHLVWGAAMGAVIAFGACASDTIDGEHATNQAPSVWLAAAPPEGSTGTYTVQLFWGGWDPDGEIAKYEYLVTDNVTGVFNPADTVDVPWNPVVGNDSTFTFSADSLQDDNPSSQKAIFARSHTFFIRAVDQEGLRSREPAYRSFTSRTISPEVRITVPRAELGITPADMPPISTISWIATDYVNDEFTKQDPESVQWALVSTVGHGDYASTIQYLRENPAAPEWYPWSWYRAPGDSGKSWTTPPLEFGDYVFAIRAKDEAGAVTPVLAEPVNVRRLKVAERTSGPTFVLTSTLVGSIIAASCDFPLTIADVPAGIDMAFNLSACADHYGGTVSGYRYGWDILDLNDPGQWEIDYTPFISSIATTPARSFNFGTHTFTAEVIDNSGFCSRIEVKVNIIRFTGERNVLIVDDYRADEVPGQSGWAATNGGVPSDAEHDNFWKDMVSNLEGFDELRDMIQTSQDRELPLTTIAGYKNIVWSVYSDLDTKQISDLPMLYTFIQYRSKRPPANSGGACSPTGGVSGKVLPNYVGLAMEAGVHMLIAGNHPVQNVVPRFGTFAVRYPVIPLYELEPGNVQTGSGPDPEDIDNPPGDLSFAYKAVCVDVIDYGIMTNQRVRGGTGTNRRYCAVQPAWRAPNASSRRDDGMRSGIPADLNFPPISLRPETSDPGRLFAPESQSIDVEVYNPAYFRIGQACQYVPAQPRPCFEPIYLLGCLDTAERTYQQPVAFWSSTFANVVAEDIPNAVGARSAVFGFPPVYFNPGEIKPAIEYILFDEWQLPRKQQSASAAP
jgi:hypothetical protein